MANPNNEVLTWSPDEIIKVTSLEDFKRKINISELPEWDLKEYFNQPLEFTKSELQRLRVDYLKWIPDHNNIKNFLVEKNSKAIELSKHLVDKWQEIVTSLEKWHKINQEWSIEKAEAAKNIDATVDKALDVANETWWKVVKEVQVKAPELLNKTKDAIEKWVDSVKELWFIGVLEKLKEEWWILGFLAWILLFLVNLGWFGSKEGKIGEAKDNIKEKLNPEQIEKTKVAIKNTIIKNYPGSEKYVNSILDNPKVLTEEKIRNLYEKIKSGKSLTLNDLTNEFKELDIPKFLKEKKEQAFEFLYKKIQEELEVKYNKKLDDKQIVSLRRLISTKLVIWDWNIEEIESRIVKDNQLQIKDIMPLISEIWASTAWFILWLITENIISAWDIAMEFADKWWEVIKLSIWALWLSNMIKMDDIYKDFDGLWEKEKAVLIWLLYRKWWLFFNVCWSLVWWTSKLALETFLPTNSWVDWFKILKDGLTSDSNLKQVENFEKIEKALIWTSEIPEWTSVLKEAIQNINEVKKNFVTLELLEKSNWDVKKFYELVSEFESTSNIKLELWAGKFNTFEELRNGLSEKISSWYTPKYEGSIRAWKNKYLWFWQESAIHELNKQIEVIKNNQSRIVLWKLNLSPLKKITDSISLSKVSRLWDRLLFELRGKDDAKAFLKQMNELAKQSPDLVKGIFNKLPIIAVWWLAATWEEPFFESLKKEMPYLLPIVWPVLMIADSWIDWTSFNPKFIKPEQTAIAWVLLTIDWYFLLNEKWLINKWKYLVKPVKDLFEMWKWTIEVWQKLYRWWSVIDKELITKAVQQTKAIKWKARLIAILWLIWVWAFEYAFAEGNDSLKNYFKDWKLDKEKIKQDSSELKKEEKEAIIKMIFVEEYTEEALQWVEFRLNSDKSFEITSSNEKIQSDWITNNDIKENLNDLFWIDKFDFIYKQKTA